MIQLYKEDNKNFNLGGDITLNPYECEFNAKLNGAWSLKLVHPVDVENRYKYIKEGSVIRFPTPTRKDDLFRINEVIKTHDSIEAYAEPLPKDLRKKVIQDINIVGKDGQGSIERILEGTGFKGYSNIIDVTNIRIVRKTVYSALFGDEDNTFISRLGGEVFTNKFDIYINDHIGTDSKNLYATFGVNLQELEEVTNMENVYTRLWPQIYNGHTFDCVDSERINNYANVLEGFIKFEDIKLEEDATEEEKNNKEFYTEENAKLEVIKRCKKLFEDGLDLPSKTYTLSIANLDNLDLYRKYKFVTKIDLGDLIIVRDKVLDAEVKARCIEFTWDCLREEYTQLVLGTEEKNIFNDVSDASNYLKDILTSNNTISGSAIEGIINAVNVQLKAQYNIAEHQHVRAMLFEDLDEESPTFGALCIGTKGLEISNKRNAQDTDWEWGTFITAGIVSADFIRTGLLSNMDGSFIMDLGRSKGMEFFIDNKKSMQINRNSIDFFDNDGNKLIGGLLSTNKISNKNDKSLVLRHRNNSFLDISYYDEETNTNKCYIQFDKYNVDDKYSYPISVAERTDFFAKVCHYYPLEMRSSLFFQRDVDGTLISAGSVFQSSNNNLVISCNTTNSLNLSYTKDNSSYAAINIHRDDNAKNGCMVDLYGVTTIYNDLTVKGTKNRAVDTENYGTRLLNAYETAECYFGDIGKATTGEECKVKINLDTVFLETVDTSIDYHVFLSKYGRGDIWVSERAETYFIVESENPNLKFSYEIKAKQIDYTENRLEEFKNSSMDISESIINSIDIVGKGEITND